MQAREADGKEFGVIVIAEGLGQYLPASYLEGIKFDDHGHISLAQTNLARTMVKAVEAEYKKRTGKTKRLTGLQLGYEARCALPHAFDVILGSQLGVGAYRALVENHLDGVLISCSGQLNLSYVPFDTLVDPETLVTVVRFIRPAPTSTAWPVFWRIIRTIEREYQHGNRHIPCDVLLGKAHGVCLLPFPAHFAITQRASSTKLGGLPCISRPVRKILPAAQTTAIAVRVVRTTESTTCQAGGAGRRASPAA